MNKAKSAHVEEIELAAIQVDAYQRPLDAKRANQYVSEFNEALVGVPLLARRADGTLYVYDGQHRLWVLIQLGYTHFWCSVVDSPSAEAEAAWFAALNGTGGTKRVKKTELFNAHLMAKDPVALDVLKLLGDYGLTVSKGGTHVGKTNSVSALMKYVKSDKERLVRAMDAIDRLWSQEEKAWTQIILRGMWEVAGNPELLDHVETGLSKGKISPQRALDMAAGMQESTGTSGGGSAFIKSAILKLAKVCA